MDTMIPITAEDLSNVPRARATRLSYDWGDHRRYSVWIADFGVFGWSVMTDYGQAGAECVVTSPHTRDGCVEELSKYVRNYGDPRWGYGFTVDEWETVSVRLDAWINWNASH
jgi:hypothetical protein